MCGTEVCVLETWCCETECDVPCELCVEVLEVCGMLEFDCSVFDGLTA